MDIIKIIGVGITALIIIIILKQYKPEFTVYVSLIAGTIILFMVMDKLSGVVSILTSLTEKTGVGSTFLKVLLKIMMKQLHLQKI